MCFTFQAEFVLKWCLIGQFSAWCSSSTCSYMLVFTYIPPPLPPTTTHELKKPYSIRGEFCKAPATIVNLMNIAALLIGLLRGENFELRAAFPPPPPPPLPPWGGAWALGEGRFMEGLPYKYHKWMHAWGLTAANAKISNATLSL